MKAFMESEAGHVVMGLVLLTYGVVCILFVDSALGHELCGVGTGIIGRSMGIALNK